MAHTEENGNACWLWRGSKKPNGYGKCEYNGKTNLYPHRLMLEAKLGRPISPGMDTRHSCDNRACVNPAHLSEGTRSDNMRDCVRRGRHVNNFPIPTGEKHPATTLTDADVVAMRTSAESHQEVADRHGISVITVRAIRGRRSWKHLP